MANIIQDDNGNVSSKRISGIILVIGILVIAIMAAFKDTAQAANILWPIVTLAGACFGATAFEKKK